MQSRGNISNDSECAFLKTENRFFQYSESTDTQCAYFLQNTTSSTGKERDSETGFSYFGARYYDSDMSGLFLSVDPMSDKYPNISPYAYCAWNPVKLVDPNGEFGVPTHKRMVKNALKNHTALSKSQQKQIVKATGWYSDWKNGDQPIHMDNHNPNSPIDQGVGNIESVFINAIKNYGDNIDNGNYRDAGVNLHTIADFYSHSNYVEICRIFKKYVNEL